MKYIIKSIDNIIYSSRMALDDYVLEADEEEITKEQYDTLTLPAVWEDGNLVPSDVWPVTPVYPADPDQPGPEQEPTTEEILDVLLGVTE